MSTLSDFLSRKRGQERRQRLNELLNYYIPPNLRPAADFAGGLTPSASYEGAVQGFEQALTPGATAADIVGGVGQGLSGTMGIAAPLAVANKAGMPAAQAAQEAFVGFSTGADYAGNVIKDRLNQPGPMPTVYSNPIPGLSGHNGGPSMTPSPQDFKRVSTRLPTGKGATENPLTDSLVSDTEAFLRNPSAAQNMQMMTETYPGFRSLLSEDPVETSENIITHMRDNIISLYDLADEAGITVESSKWYDGANRIANEMATRFNSTPEKAAGVLAVLSPQKDWYQNVALGERIMKHMNELPASAKWTPEMDRHSLTKAADKEGQTAWTKSDIFESDVRGRPWGEMDTPQKKAMWLRAYDEATFGSAFREVSPEGDILDYVTKKDGAPATLVHQSFPNIAKAIRIIEGDGALETISGELGSEHKVRNFFNNILTPESPFDVTADTHQIAGGLLMPYGSAAPEVGHGLAGQSAPRQGMPWSATGGKDSGISGAYGLHFDATKRAAEATGDWLPRQMQSITWEQLRALMPSTIRGNHPFVNTARTIWRMKDEGQITAEEARKMIIVEAQKAGGGAKPSWVDYKGPRRSIARGAGATAGLLGVTGAGLASAQTSDRDR